MPIAQTEESYEGKIKHKPSHGSGKGLKEYWLWYWKVLLLKSCSNVRTRSQGCHWPLKIKTSQGKTKIKPIQYYCWIKNVSYYQSTSKQTQTQQQKGRGICVIRNCAKQYKWQKLIIWNSK